MIEKVFNRIFQRSLIKKFNFILHKEEEARPEHTIGLYPCKPIYLDILTMHRYLINYTANMLLIV